MDRERYTCTPDAPWTPDKGAAEHPGAEYLGEDFDGCCDRYRCSNCGLRFKVTLRATDPRGPGEPGRSPGGLREMAGRPQWDATFLDEGMDIVREMVEDAIKSRRKVFEETYTMTTYGRRVETITVTVKRER